MAAGWPRWLVPLLAAAMALTTHDRPHNSPHKSAALGLFWRWQQARADHGCGHGAGDNVLWQVLVTLSAITAAHRPELGEQGEMAGVSWPAYCWYTIGSRAVPGSRGGAVAGGDAGRWRSRS